MIKIANTQFPVNELIKNRWSARSFANTEISDDTINTLLEAASWAPSANNEQPWKFHVAKKTDSSFDKVWESLMQGNKPWCKNAAAFITIFARDTFSANEKPNAWASHDVGIATGYLLLQATSMQIYCHPMAGYDKQILQDNLQYEQGLIPQCIIALGYLDDAEKLEEPYKTRELTPRARKTVDELLISDSI
jgi:nitroreductase